MGLSVRVSNFPFFSGVHMVIYKEYKVEDENTIRVVYTIKVSYGDKRDNIVFYDFIEHKINIEEGLAKIPQFEQEAEKKEKELKEKAVKILSMVKELKSMGYTEVGDVGD